MMRFNYAIAATLVASPAFAATGPFFSLKNTDFIVLLAFLLFVGILVYFKVPKILGDLLDKRAEGIRNDLEDAKRLREEAQELYARYERRQREVKDQAQQIVDSAKRDAEAHAEKAKADLKSNIERRLKAAEDQITTAENDAVRAVRNTAISAAIAAASDVLRGQMSKDSAGIDASIAEVEKRLN